MPEQLRTLYEAEIARYQDWRETLQLAGYSHDAAVMKWYSEVAAVV